STAPHWPGTTPVVPQNSSRPPATTAAPCLRPPTPPPRAAFDVATPPAPVPKCFHAHSQSFLPASFPTLPPFLETLLRHWRQLPRLRPRPYRIQQRPLHHSPQWLQPTRYPFAPSIGLRSVHHIRK